MEVVSDLSEETLKILLGVDNIQSLRPPVVLNFNVKGWRLINADGLQLLPADCLVEIDATNNVLTNLDVLAHFTNLVTVRVAWNLLTSVAFTSSQLEVIDLSNNQLVAIPDLSRLSKLHTLNVAHNYIATLRPAVECLNLTTLDARSNCFEWDDLQYEQELENLGRLVRLASLNLDNNSFLHKFSDSRVDILAACPSLKRFNDQDISEVERVYARNLTHRGAKDYAALLASHTSAEGQHGAVQSLNPVSVPLLSAVAADAVVSLRSAAEKLDARVSEWEQGVVASTTAPTVSVEPRVGDRAAASALLTTPAPPVTGSIDDLDISHVCEPLPIDARLNSYRFMCEEVVHAMTLNRTVHTAVDTWASLFLAGRQQLLCIISEHQMQVAQLQNWGTRLDSEITSLRFRHQELRCAIDESESWKAQILKFQFRLRSKLNDIELKKSSADLFKRKTEATLRRAVNTHNMKMRAHELNHTLKRGDRSELEMKEQRKKLKGFLARDEARRHELSLMLDEVSKLGTQMGGWCTTLESSSAKLAAKFDDLLAWRTQLEDVLARFAVWDGDLMGAITAASRWKAEMASFAEFLNESRSMFHDTVNQTELCRHVISAFDEKLTFVQLAERQGGVQLGRPAAATVDLIQHCEKVGAHVKTLNEHIITKWEDRLAAVAQRWRGLGARFSEWIHVASSLLTRTEVMHSELIANLEQTTKYRLTHTETESINVLSTLLTADDEKDLLQMDVTSVPSYDRLRDDLAAQRLAFQRKLAMLSNLPDSQLVLRTDGNNAWDKDGSVGATQLDATGPPEGTAGESEARAPSPSPSVVSSQPSRESGPADWAGVARLVSETVQSTAQAKASVRSLVPPALSRRGDAHRERERDRDARGGGRDRDDVVSDSSSHRGSKTIGGTQLSMPGRISGAGDGALRQPRQPSASASVPSAPVSG
eukprot:gnl/Spiro4/29596_TR14505_c0_g1_i1.p1 gnl/Spiro4/29596_TR14505_c0_g1~~gnl/Spiro4/29596_TR14505_c0_g1_i1.p1  ORF type:complete len:936 (+),score=280.56 gnl/Spiro4/29596_TR14505_c0_g1_i1:85-2892(+)